MTKFHLKHFIESIPFEDVNPEQIRQSNYKFRNIHNKQNKLTRFEIYPETELACKYTKPVYKTKYNRNSCQIQRWFRHEYRKINNTFHGYISLNH